MRTFTVDDVFRMVELKLINRLEARALIGLPSGLIETTQEGEPERRWELSKDKDA